MRLRYYKRRTVYLDYAAAITFTVPSECDTLRIGQLTGPLALSIVDPNAKDGDYFKVLYQGDGTARALTIGGTNGQAATYNIATATGACLQLVFNETIAKYVPVVQPG